MTVPADMAPLRRTPLYRMHAKLGARFVPFAGYDMPIQFAAGILNEHLHTRAAAGLFDVSHMGQLLVRARTGNPDAAAQALEGLVPQDILSLPAGRQRYACLFHDRGRRNPRRSDDRPSRRPFPDDRQCCLQGR